MIRGNANVRKSARESEFAAILSYESASV
jgi:hypothetical protein